MNHLLSRLIHIPVDIIGSFCFQKEAATVYALAINASSPQRFPPEFINQSARVIIRPRVVNVASNSSVTIMVKFIRPTDLDVKRIPIYSGYIRIHSSKAEIFYVPYAGVGTSMKDIAVTDFRNGFPYFSRDSAVNGSRLSIDTNNTFQFPAQQLYIHWRLAMGSSLVRIDVLGFGKKIMIAGRKILGSITEFPLRYQSRDNVSTSAGPFVRTVSSWNGTLSDNKTVPTGCYQLLYRALKIFGDYRNKNDYESKTSPTFCVKY